MSIVWRLMERIFNTLDQVYILLTGPVGKGQLHVVHVKLEQGGLVAPLFARDTKTELGGFTYVKEVVKISLQEDCGLIAIGYFIFPEKGTIFKRKRAVERQNTTDISQVIRPLTRCKKTRRSKGRPRVVHNDFQVRGNVNCVASDGTDIQYVGSSTIELEGVYILLTGPVGKGQPHVVLVKLEQGGLVAPLLARDTKTELGGFTYVKEVVKIRIWSNTFCIYSTKKELIYSLIYSLC
nr:hypothetical protein [Tanacetum cinerariifolium]